MSGRIVQSSQICRAISSLSNLEAKCGNPLFPESEHCASYRPCKAATQEAQRILRKDWPHHMAIALDTGFVHGNGLVPVFMQAPQVRAFWQHVDSLMSASGHVPVRDFDLMDMHRLAPEMIVCDVDIESCRNRLRFVGTRVVEVFGEETTGRYLDEVNIGPFRSQQLAAFNMAVASGWPQWMKVIVSASVDKSVPALQPTGLIYERLVVPLAGDDGAVKQLAAVVSFREDVCEQSAFEHVELPPGRY